MKVTILVLYLLYSIILLFINNNSNLKLVRKETNMIFKILTSRVCFYIITFFVIISCSGIVRTKRKYNEVDPALVSYTRNFIKNSNGKIKKIKKISMGFTNIDSKKNQQIIGRCNFTLDGGVEIDIHYPYWRDSNEIEREFLVYHELGHCVCSMSHRNEELEDGCPISIMNYRTMHQWCAVKHYKYYIKELYDGC